MIAFGFWQGTSVAIVLLGVGGFMAGTWLSQPPYRATAELDPSGADASLVAEARQILTALTAAGGRPIAEGSGLFPRDPLDQLIYAKDRCAKATEPSPNSTSPSSLAATVEEICSTLEANRDLEGPLPTFPGEVHRPAKASTDSGALERARAFARDAALRLRPHVEATERLLAEAGERSQ